MLGVGVCNELNSCGMRLALVARLRTGLFLLLPMLIAISCVERNKSPLSGTWRGVCAAYDLKKKSGEYVEVFGNRVQVPEVDYTLVIDGSSSVHVEFTSGDDGRTYRYDASFRVTEDNEQRYAISWEAKVDGGTEAMEVVLDKQSRRVVCRTINEPPGEPFELKNVNSPFSSSESQPEEDWDAEPPTRENEEAPFSRAELVALNGHWVNDESDCAGEGGLWIELIRDTMTLSGWEWNAKAVQVTPSEGGYALTLKVVSEGDSSEMSVQLRLEKGALVLDRNFREYCCGDGQSSLVKCP